MAKSAAKKQPKQRKRSDPVEEALAAFDRELLRQQALWLDEAAQTLREWGAGEDER